jgi:hypothetical protein
MAPHSGARGMLRAAMRERWHRSELLSVEIPSS